MLLTWYTIRALAREWSAELVGHTLTDAWSSSRNELTLVLASPEEAVLAIRISVDPARRYLFSQAGGGKPRKNVTSLFPAALGREITEFEVADRDRMLDIRVAGGSFFRVMLFGPRSNVLLAGPDGVVVEAFRERIAPAHVPDPQAAPDPATAADLQQRWPKGAQPMARALTRAVPLFDAWLAEEAVSRAALDVSDACLVEEPHFVRLSEAVNGLRRELEAPRPVVYRDGRVPVAFSLLPLRELPGEAAAFDTVSDAVREFVRAELSEGSFRKQYDPLFRSLEALASRNAERAAAMLNELTKPSRADQYEQWGHLLMAGGTTLKAGSEVASVPDLFGDGTVVEIPMDPALNGLENAQRYYLRARRTRRSRQDAEQRYDAVAAEADQAQALLSELALITERKALKGFMQQHERFLSTLQGKASSDADAIPFRRYHLEGGYEVWVGRNAKQNDLLTFKHARKHDLWLHARGMPGSHTVLRHSSKNASPPRHVLEAAASIAAWHSKARGSSLVPVIVAERKYVRKPRKATPGAVLVDREEVLIVPPELPAGSDRE